MTKSRSEAPIIAFVGLDDASRLCRASDQAIRRWVRLGVFVPEHAPEVQGDVPRIFSFRDLVGLRTIALLRERGVPLQEIRSVGQRLATERDRPWSAFRFYILSGHLHWLDGDAVLSGRPLGQKILSTEHVDLEHIASDVRQSVSEISRRKPEQVGKVASHRGVQGGALCIEGTRIPVATIASLVSDGVSVKEILIDYPTLREADIKAAVASSKGRRSAA